MPIKRLKESEGIEISQKKNTQGGEGRGEEEQHSSKETFRGADDRSNAKTTTSQAKCDALILTMGDKNSTALVSKLKNQSRTEVQYMRD